MYTILLNDDNKLVTSVRERIMQRSKLVDSLHFLVEPIYKKEHDMSEFTAVMEYLSPISREYHVEYLKLSSELYKGKLEYTVPFDTALTKEAGNVEVQLTFTKVDLDVHGNPIQNVRKTSKAVITIVPIEAWSNIIADSALTALDQRLIQVDAMINAANEMNQHLYETQVDNIYYDKEGKYIQLTANGQPVGDRVEWVNNGGCSVVDVKIDDNNDLIVTLSDGRVINVGRVAKNDGVTFIPHVSEDYILSWTNDGGLENPKPVDLYPHDEWIELEHGPEIPTEYTWEFL